MGISQHTLVLPLTLEPTRAGAAILGGEVAATFLTANGPAKGVFGGFIFATDTTDATANLDRVLPFYQGIVDTAEFTGSSLVLGISLANDSVLGSGGWHRAQLAPSTWRTIHRVWLLGWMHSARTLWPYLGWIVTSLPAEGARCGFSESRIVLQLSSSDTPRADRRGLL